MEEYQYGIGKGFRDFGLERGELKYYEHFMSADLADAYFDVFTHLPFIQGYVPRGKERRLTCFLSTAGETVPPQSNWLASSGLACVPRGATAAHTVDNYPPEPLKIYKYAGKVNIPHPYTDELRMLQAGIEWVTGCKYNACLVNLYPDGTHVIGYHSDSESSLVAGSTIASISLGAERWFDVISKENMWPTGSPGAHRKESIRTAHGSLITMGGDMQSYYLHQIRQETRVKNPRINLTFRLVK